MTGAVLCLLSPGVRYDFVPEAGHLLFVEYPEICAERVREFAVSCGLLSA